MRKHLRHLIMLLTFLILIPVIFQVQPAYAEGKVSFVGFKFSSQKIYQGDSGLSVSLSIINDGNASIRLHGAQVHFDWQATNESFIIGVSKGGQPFDLRRIIAPNQNYTFMISFSVPTTATAGYHFFEFSVFHDYETVTGFVLDQTATWFPDVLWSVYNVFEKSYGQLQPTVASKIARAEGAGFISPEANSLVQQAKTYENDAADFAAEGEWQYAVGRLQGASAFIDQAYTAEQNFRNYLIYGLIIGVIAIIAVGLFVRRRRHSSKSVTAKGT